jgi:tRNA1Val (adenine37-N6)-methyltransferase
MAASWYAWSVPDDEFTSDALTADFRVLQRRRGHRFSLDDLATAWVAASACPAPRVVLDLGCGIGSVLLMVGWRCREARLFGIEAQEVSVELARRNIALNGLAGRATIEHGDLRDLSRERGIPRCDLVTGTPPYLPLGTALLSPDPQRAAARIELRGGVEDYLAAAARVLAEEGFVVVCADGRYPARVLKGASEVGLVPLRRLDVFARAGAGDPLLAVWTLRRPGAGPAALEHEVIAMRDERGGRTEASFAMRRFFGLDGGLR